jgi:acetylornithine deacetylase
MTDSKSLQKSKGVTEFLKGLVEIPSVNPNLCKGEYSEGEIVLAIEGWAAAVGLSSERLVAEGERESLIVTLPGKNPEKSIIFESHTDTVSVTQMTIEPFVADVREGRMYGRGSCDTKASAAAMAWALKDLHESGDKPEVTLHWVAAVDEEYGMTGAIALADWIKGRQAVGEEVLGIVIGEPTELEPVIAHKGALHFPIVVTGEPAHGSNPHLGKNAVVQMSRIIQFLVDEYSPGLEGIEHPLTGGATINVGRIEGGTQANIVPAECTLLIDRRTAPGESNEEVLAELKERICAVPNPEGCVVDVAPLYNSCEPVCTEPEEEFVSALCSALEAAGCPNEPEGVGYATDGSRLTGCGVPIVIFGPGDIAQAHTKDEWVEIAQVEKAVEILKGIPSYFGDK